MIATVKIKIGLCFNVFIFWLNKNLVIRARCLHYKRMRKLTQRILLVVLEDNLCTFFFSVKAYIFVKKEKL